MWRVRAEPEVRDRGEDAALAGNGIRQHDVESGQAIARDDQQPVVTDRVVVAHLPAVQERQRAELRFEQRFGIHAGALANMARFGRSRTGATSTHELDRQDHRRRARLHPHAAADGRAARPDRRPPVRPVRGARTRRAARADAPAVRAAFFRATFSVMGHVAKSDGRVSEQDIAAARRIFSQFNLGDADKRAAMELYTQGKQADFDPEVMLAELAAACRGRPEVLRMFLEIQMRAALMADGLQGAVARRARARRVGARHRCAGVRAPRGLPALPGARGRLRDRRRRRAARGAGQPRLA